jgi:hypothetical protein
MDDVDSVSVEEGVRVDLGEEVRGVVEEGRVDCAGKDPPAKRGVLMSTCASKQSAMCLKV